jgi:hypothetical protein
MVSAMTSSSWVGWIREKIGDASGKSPPIPATALGLARDKHAQQTRSVAADSLLTIGLAQNGAWPLVGSKTEILCKGGF